MSNCLNRVVFCAFALALCGCATTEVEMIGDPYFAKTKTKANVYAKQGQSGVLKIAVMPLKSTTELIGSSVSDMVVTELLRTQKYALVERGQMSKVLSETELAMAGMSESKAVETAKMLGAQAVVIGTVDEYGTQAKGGDTYAVVGLSIRLIDCANGKIIWSADLARMANDDDTPLATHARDVVHEVVAALYQNLTGQAGILPPPPPEGVSVGDMGLREATLKWTVPPYKAKYRIERAMSEEGPFVGVGETFSTAGSYRDSGGLKDASVYYYRIVGVGKSGTASDPSAVVETMTAPPPEPPTGVSAVSPSSRTVNVFWTAPGSEGVTGYSISRRKAGEGAWRVVGKSAACTYKDGGFNGCDLEDSTEYEYAVAAVNRVGAASELSATATATTPPPPAPPGAFDAKSMEIRCVPLRWERSEESEVVGYEIERAESPDGPFARLVQLKDPAATTYLDGRSDPGNLPDEKRYFYRIRAYNNVGSTSAWAEARAVTKPAPEAPKGLTATAVGAGTIKVTWDANEEPDIVEYRLESRAPGGWFWRSVAKTANLEAQEGQLGAGETREYRLMAVGPKNHEGTWSQGVNGTSRPLPAAPRGLVAVRSGGVYRVTFESPDGPMKEYRVYRKKFIGQDLLVKVGACEAELSPATVGEGIDIVVTAVDEYGLESKPSDKTPVK